jgi:hypothetical protein
VREGHHTPRWLLAALTLGLVLLALEGLSRGYWAVSRRVSLLDADEVEHAFYRELAALEETRVRDDDERFDVLLLSGSVLTKGYGDVPAELERALRERLRRPFAVHSLAHAGFTSQDSLNEYRLLDDDRFDLVVVYHSINEVRANNVRPDLFRADLSHMDWYREANFVVAHRTLARLWTLPFTLREAWLVGTDALRLRPAIGRGRPRRDMIDYGAEIRSDGVLLRNLREILAIAERRGDPVALLRFAWYLPEDYSLERFEARSLDYAYAKRFVPVEVWGHVPNVVRALEAHDAVLRRLGASGRAAYFVDVAGAVPRDGRHFSDVCHLTREGSRRLVEALLDAVPETAAARR